MAFRCLACNTLLHDGVDVSKHTCPPNKPETWFRVEADYGAGDVFVGEANDRIGYLALADRAWKDGAKNVKIYQCVRDN